MKCKKILSLMVATAFCATLLGSRTIKSSAATKDKNNDILKNMTLEEKVGQILMPAIRVFNDKPVTECNDEIKGLVSKYHLGGVILFSSNFSTVEGTVKYINDLNSSSPKIPLMFTVDQEGGGVTRIAGGTDMPGNMALAAARDSKLTFDVTKSMGKEIAAMGINATFGPVLDVFTNPINMVIGTRSFGNNADVVSDQGVAYVRGIQSNNVSATAKHFPSNGDSSVDSHNDLPVVNLDLNTIENVNLRPFQKAIDNGLDMIMPAHLSVPALDASKIYSQIANKEINMPATFSKKILVDTLRTKMGFKGVVVSDALDMGAVAKYFTQVDCATLALNGGCDILLMPTSVWSTETVKNLDNLFTGLVANVKKGVISETRLNEAVSRILDLKIKRKVIGAENKSLEQKISYAKSVVGCKEHKDLERLAAAKTTTLIKNEGNMLPMKLQDNKKVVVFAYSYDGFGINIPIKENLKESLEKIKADTKLNNLEIKIVPINLVFNDQKTEVITEKTSLEYIKEMNDADYTIVCPYLYYREKFSETFGPANSSSKAIEDIINYANKNNKNYAYINLREPYDAAYLTNSKNIILTYANLGGDIVAGIDENKRSVNIDMTLRAAFGLINPTGKLPVDIIRLEDPTKIYFNFGYGLSY